MSIRVRVRLSEVRVFERVRVREIDERESERD